MVWQIGPVYDMVWFWAMDACLCTLERAHGKIFDFTVKGISQKNIFAPVFPGEFRTWKEAFVYREFILLESVS